MGAAARRSADRQKTPFDRHFGLAQCKRAGNAVACRLYGVDAYSGRSRSRSRSGGHL